MDPYTKQKWPKRDRISLTSLECDVQQKQLPLHLLSHESDDNSGEYYCNLWKLGKGALQTQRTQMDRPYTTI